MQLILSIKVYNLMPIAIGECYEIISAVTNKLITSGSFLGDHSSPSTPALGPQLRAAAVLYITISTHHPLGGARAEAG